jgi:hypothetical protein
VLSGVGFDTFECDLVNTYTLKCHFQHSDKINEVKSIVLTVKHTLLSVEMTLFEVLFLCRNKCRNDTSVFTVHVMSVTLQ